MTFSAPTLVDEETEQPDESGKTSETEQPKESGKTSETVFHGMAPSQAVTEAFLDKTERIRKAVKRRDSGKTSETEQPKQRRRKLDLSSDSVINVPSNETQTSHATRQKHPMQRHTNVPYKEKQTSHVTKHKRPMQRNSFVSCEQYHRNKRRRKRRGRMKRKNKKI